MSALLDTLGVAAIIAAVLYAAALAGLVEVAKRWATRGVAAGGRRGALGVAVLERVHLLVALLGAATGPIVWPWLWPLVAPGAPAVPTSTSALLGVGAAGLAHLLYPLALEQLLVRAGLKRGST